jgi:hypothetical protein
LTNIGNWETQVSAAFENGQTDIYTTHDYGEPNGYIFTQKKITVQTEKITR